MFEIFNLSSKCYPPTPKTTSSERFACLYNANHLFNPTAVLVESNTSEENLMKAQFN